MPAPIFYAHNLRSLSARHAGNTPLLGPDSEPGHPVRQRQAGAGDQDVVSIQHSDRIPRKSARSHGRPRNLARRLMCEEENFLVNPTGRFVIGGPMGMRV
jgi:S-adenosylmethionine synthetase